MTIHTLIILTTRVIHNVWPPPTLGYLPRVDTWRPVQRRKTKPDCRDNTHDSIGYLYPLNTVQVSPPLVKPDFERCRALSILLVVL